MSQNRMGAYGALSEGAGKHAERQRFSLGRHASHRQEITVNIMGPEEEARGMREGMDRRGRDNEWQGARASGRRSNGHNSTGRGAQDGGE